MSASLGALLVVDDDVSVAQLLSEVFTRDFRVIKTYDAESALEVLNREPVVAVLADHMLPKMSGVDLLRETITAQPAAVRILITASQQIDDVRNAINLARVDRFIGKPLRIMELREIVLGAVREAELRQENDRLVGELRQKNLLLQRALSEVQHHERKLAREVDLRTRELMTAMKELEQLALRDGLTGLYNHRFFQEALTAELARAARNNHHIGLLFIDVDHFKNYNDVLGHPAGDALLKRLSKILVNTGEIADLEFHGRVSDIVARYGGEEFVIILPETDKQGALVRADRLRRCIERYPFERADVQPGGRVTVSIGVASYPVDAMTKQPLIDAADQALLGAKREGRNRVAGAEEAPNTTTE
jgi:diguanylate cyclase (GGDEF)-like protein